MRKAPCLSSYDRLPGSASRWVSAVPNALPILFLVLFFCVLISGIFLPVYSDEVVTKWILSRIFLESGHAVTLFPQCSNSLGKTVSFVFYPAAVLMAAVYSFLGPLGLRISGLLLTLFWFFGIAYWTFKRCPTAGGGLRSFSALTALASLGVMPYLWAMARSEQLLALGVLLFCLYPLYFNKDRSIQRLWCGAAIYILAASIFFYSHSKSIFFLPFVISSVWYAFKSCPIGVRWALSIFVLALGVEVIQDASSLARCADAPMIQKMLDYNVLSPSLMFLAPIEFFSRGFTNLWQSPGRVIEHLVINNAYQSGWLPPLGILQAEVGLLNRLIRCLLLFLIAGSHLLAVMIFGWKFVSRNLSPAVVLALLLAAAGAANSFIYEAWHFYSGIQFVPVSITLLCLCLPQLPNLSIPRRIRGLFLCCLLAVAAASILTLFSNAFPILRNNSDIDQANIIGQPLSIPTFGTESHLASIRNLGERCGLTLDRRKYLVVDHMTYFAYRENKQPIHILYVSELGFGGDLGGGRLLPFLKKIDSPGVISRCEWIPAELQGMAQRDDKGYCCVNLDKIVIEERNDEAGLNP
jgi:hypothetical protein